MICKCAKEPEALFLPEKLIGSTSCAGGWHPAPTQTSTDPSNAEWPPSMMGHWDRGYRKGQIPQATIFCRNQTHRFLAEASSRPCGDADCSAPARQSPAPERCLCPPASSQHRYPAGGLATNKPCFHQTFPTTNLPLHTSTFLICKS